MRPKRAFFLTLLAGSRGGIRPAGRRRQTLRADSAARRATDQSLGHALRHPVPCDFISKEKIKAVPQQAHQRRRQARGPTRRRTHAQEIRPRAAGFRPRQEHRRTAYRAGRRLLRLRPEETVHHRHHVLGDTGARALARDRPRHRRPELQPRQVHQGGPQKRRWRHRAPRRHGRPGHLADVRTAGAQDGAIAQGLAGAVWP